MAPTTCVAGQLGATAAWPTCRPSNGRGAAGACAREEFVVEPGKTSTFRIVNLASQVYTTVCFQVGAGGPVSANPSRCAAAQPAGCLHPEAMLASTFWDSGRGPARSGDAPAAAATARAPFNLLSPPPVPPSRATM